MSSSESVLFSLISARIRSGIRESGDVFSSQKLGRNKYPIKFMDPLARFFGCRMNMSGFQPNIIVGGLQTTNNNGDSEH